MSSSISITPPLEIKDSDINFSFTRKNSYDGKLYLDVTYTGLESISDRALQSEEYQIDASYHPKGFSRGCQLFWATSLFIVGPVTIYAGLQTDSTLKIIAGISMSAIFAISTIFSCGLMIRGEMGIKKFKAEKIEELRPSLKERIHFLISKQESPSSKEEEGSINKHAANPSELDPLL